MKFSTIQFLRFIAALLVLLFHLQLSKSGYKGVDIFFVISGFIMYLKLFISPRPPAFVFYVNRLTKIFLLYWVALIILHSIRSYPLNLKVISSFILLQVHPQFGLTWTLIYELYFYFLIGIIAYLLTDKSANLTLLVLLIISVILGVMRYCFDIKVYYTTFLLGKNTMEFLFGALSAYLSHKFIIRVNANILLPIIALIFGLLIEISIPQDDLYARGFVYGILVLMLLYTITHYEMKYRLNKWVKAAFNMLGEASYALYLIAPLVSMVIQSNTILLKMINILVCVLLAILLNKLIELNGLPWIRKHIYSFKTNLLTLLLK